jgi:hypothetical protein
MESASSGLHGYLRNQPRIVIFVPNTYLLIPHAAYLQRHQLVARATTPSDRFPAVPKRSTEMNASVSLFFPLSLTQMASQDSNHIPLPPPSAPPQFQLSRDSNGNLFYCGPDGLWYPYNVPPPVRSNLCIMIFMLIAVDKMPQMQDPRTPAGPGPGSAMGLVRSNSLCCMLDIDVDTTEPA